MEEAVWDWKSNCEVEVAVGMRCFAAGAENDQLVRGQNRIARTGC
jgi:hypothetical protein